MTAPNGITYAGKTVREDGERVSLTDMHKASGGDPAKQPGNWTKSAQAVEFATFLAGNQTPSDSGSSLIETKEGRNGGTWAHWQLALAYAKYLSPEFHAHVNEVYRARVTGAALLVSDRGEKMSVAAAREQRLLERERRLDRESKSKALTQWADRVEERGLASVDVADAYRNEAASIIVGRPLLESRPNTEKLYTATDIGSDLEISAVAIGKLARECGTHEVPGFGIHKMSKAAHHDGLVSHWVYNETGRARILAAFRAKGTA